MERYRNFIKMEEMKEHLRNNRPEAALKIAETLNISKIKSLSDINNIAEVFLENDILVKAKEYYTYIFKKNRSRRVIMQLINICIRLKNANEAERYYQEYLQLDKNDFYQYIYRYSIDKMEGKPYPVLIEHLEELKKHEYIDTWAYELAKLYHKSGNSEKCISECTDIVTWFGEGEITDKAKALRAYYLGETELEDLDSDKNTTEDTNSKDYILEDTIDEKDVKEELIEDEEIIKEETLESEDQNVYIATDIKMDTEEEVADTRADDGNEMLGTETETTEIQSRMSNEEEDEVEAMLLKLLKEEEEILKQAVSYEMKTEESKNNSLTNTKDTHAEPVSGNEIHTQETADQDYREKSEEEQNYLQQPIDMSVIGYMKRQRADCVIGNDSFLSKFLVDSGNRFEEYFGFAAYQESVRAQLIKCFESLLNPQIRNICVTISGEKNCGRHSIIKGIIKILHANGILQGLQVAALDAEKVNSIKISEKSRKLSGYSLIINRAGSLTTDAAKELLILDEKTSGKTAVFLVDDRSALTKLFRDNRDLNGMFPNRIHIPSYSIEDMKDAAYLKFREAGCPITGGAWEEIVKKIQIIYKSTRNGVLKDTDDYLAKIIDEFETKKAERFISNTLEGTHTEQNDIITRDDIKKLP